MKVPTRSQTIERLRELLVKRSDSKHSLCLLMGREGLFCRGFAAWDDVELAQHFHWFQNTRPEVERTALEDLADHWQLADQTSRGLQVPCDIAGTLTATRCGCRGWARFDDGQVAELLRELEARGD